MLLEKRKKYILRKIDSKRQNKFYIKDQKEFFSARVEQIVYQQRDSNSFPSPIRILSLLKKKFNAYYIQFD